jgi:hypothetical protein
MGCSDGRQSVEGRNERCGDQPRGNVLSYPPRTDYEQSAVLGRVEVYKKGIGMNLPLFCQTSQRATLFYYLCVMGAVMVLVAIWFVPEIAPLY